MGNDGDDGNRGREQCAARKVREDLTRRASVIDRVKRTSRNVGSVVVVMPRMLVRHSMAVTDEQRVMVALCRADESEVGADPGQRAERGKDERSEREPRHREAQARAPRPPMTGWSAPMQRQDHRTPANSCG